jgi:plastocyanin
MKKAYLFVAFLLAAHYLFATNHIVTVADFQFTPKDINVNVGDSVTWQWSSGVHTTTSKTIPVGASSWDDPMTASSTTFTYKVTVAGVYDYVCTLHEAFGMIGSITASDVLPVVLNDFGVMETKTKAAQLYWSTATELNTDHFDIMRSTDGSSYDKIGSVAAKGNSAIITNYTYTDNTLPNSTYIYYYLNIVDKDGQHAFSEIKSFKNENSVQKLIVSLSPNPINKPGHLMLQFNADKAGSMHVQLFDLSGKLVTQTDMSAVAGLNYGHFHMGDVASGTYTIVFTMDGLKESYKVVVQ